MRTPRSSACSSSAPRAEWQEFASNHDCCLEPVLDIDEALDSELVRAREMVVEVDQPGAEQPVRLLASPVKLSAHAGQRRPARPGARRAHRRGARLDRLLTRGDRAMKESGAAAGAAAGAEGSFLS